jgi:hypothetical protein
MRMVGNAGDPEWILGFEKREDCFAWIPRKTNAGWRWLIRVVRVTRTVEDDSRVSGFIEFMGFGSLRKQAVTWETKEWEAHAK